MFQYAAIMANRAAHCYSGLREHNVLVHFLLYRLCMMSLRRLESSAGLFVSYLYKCRQYCVCLHIGTDGAFPLHITCTAAQYADLLKSIVHTNAHLYFDSTCFLHNALLRRPALFTLKYASLLFTFSTVLNVI